MGKSWQQILDDVDAMGQLPATSFAEYQRRAEEAKKSDSPRPLAPARAKVEKLDVAKDGQLTLRVLVDLDEPNAAARYRHASKLDELIVNAVRLKDAELNPVRASGPRRMEVVLTGKTDAANADRLRSYPLSVRVRSADDTIQIDGFELGLK